MARPTRFILASGSARRRELLDQMGLHYDVVKIDVDERAHEGEAAADYVCRIAASKARAVAAGGCPQCCVLAADTAVVLDGKILGKPASTADAVEMLLSLSGRMHDVFSAVVLLTTDGRELRRLNVSSVTFAVLDQPDIEAYCASEEPLDKAGAYAIQGFAAQWISRLEGSYSGVMGLPLYETMDLLRQAGIRAVP